MKVGKLGEGVYLLTVGPSGRTVKRAKMVKATKKTPEETQNVAAEPKYEPEVKYIPAKEIAKTLGINVNRVYDNHTLLAKYIIRPDGRHYLYNPALLEDAAVVQFLKYGLTLKKAEKKQEEAPKVEEAPVVEAIVETQAVSKIERPAADPITVNRKVYCKEMGRSFDSVTDAAKAIGTRREALSKALRAGHKCRGYTCSYVDAGPLPMWNQAKVIAEKYGITAACVYDRKGDLPDGMVVRKKDGSYWFHRDVIDLPIWQQVVANKAQRTPHPVIVEELKKTFPTLAAAAHHIGGYAHHISKAIKTGKPYKGYHFAYA